MQVPASPIPMSLTIDSMPVPAEKVEASVAPDLATPTDVIQPTSRFAMTCVAVLGMAAVLGLGWTVADTQDTPVARGIAIGEGPSSDPDRRDGRLIVNSIVPMTAAGAQGAVSRFDVVAELAAALSDLPPAQRITVTATKDYAADFDRLKRGDGSRIEMRTTRFTQERSAVSYFHDEDATAARRIAERIAADTIDLRGLEPSPPPGTVDVSLVGG